MRYYTDEKKLNDEIDLIKRHLKEDGVEAEVGSRFEPYFDKLQVKFIDAWVITLDGWPQ